MSSWSAIAIVLEVSKRACGEFAARQLMRRFDRRQLAARPSRVVCACAEVGESAELMRSMLLALQGEYPEIDGALRNAARAVARAQLLPVAQPACRICQGKGTVLSRINPLGRFSRLRFCGGLPEPLHEWMASCQGTPPSIAIVDPQGRWWEPQAGGLAFGWGRGLLEIANYRRHIVLKGEYQ